MARLGRYLDQRAAQVTAASGSMNEALMLVMVSLMVADELADTTAELENLTGGSGIPAQSAAARSEAEKQAVKVIDGLTERIERIAARLDAT